MVKLTWTKEWQASLAATTAKWANVTFPFQTGTRTYPTVATPASMCLLGSHFCTPLGSATAGYNEDYPSGLLDWSTFYEQAICFGSSISIQMFPSGASATTVPDIRYVLLAIACQDTDDVTEPNEAVSVTKNRLDVLDYEDLSSYPGARSGYIKSALNTPTRIKMFRKTKSMLGLKDLTDNQELRMILPTSANINTGSNTMDGTTNSASLGWLWYLRLFPFSPAAEPLINFTIRVNYYTQLSSRTIILQETANAA